MEYRQNPDVLAENLDLDGRDVLDVGCGTGHLTRLMAGRGAHVVGLECNKGQLSQAHAAEPAGDETYVDGVAEVLPLAEDSIDIVVFSNSLHHVPIGGQAKALQEAARVLRPGGTVYISEPLAEGNFFELVQPVHDETKVRDHAYQAIQGAGVFGFETVSEAFHCHRVRFPDFESFQARITAINPDTAENFRNKDQMMRTAFSRLGRRDGEGWVFDQPTRVNVLRKT